MAKSSTFSDEEKAAMKEAAAERRAAASRGTGSKKAQADLQDCLDKIAAMEDGDRAIGEVLHAVVTTHAPDLAPKTWYGMPAYANGDGKVVVFFQVRRQVQDAVRRGSASRSGRISTTATCGPRSFAVTTMTPAVEKKLTALVKKAVR